MRIENLHIDGFGHFFNCDIGPFDNRITVIHGANEAGKSTLLSFVRTMLFGFPARNRDQFYPPLAGGQHGGRITVIGKGGVRYIIERAAGVRGGSIRVTIEGGEVLEDEAPLQRLLGHASKEMFEAVFAFGLGELQNLDTLNKSEVSARIYSAGMGAANLPAALNDLSRERDKIFKSGGSNQPVAEALNELQEIETKLDQARGDAAEYGRLAKRREDIGTDIEAATERVGALSARQKKLELLQQAWEDWVKLGELKQRSSELPALEGFPENAIGRLDGEEGRLRDARDELAEARQQLEAAEAAAKAPIADEAILDDAEDIERIRRGRNSFDDAVRDLPKVEAQLRSQENALALGLKDLGPDWDEARLESFDISVPVRDEVEQWRKQLEEVEQALREANTEVARADREAREAAEAAEEARAAFEQSPKPDLDAAAIEQQRVALRASRSRLGDYLRAKDRREDLQYQAAQTGETSAAVGDRRQRVVALLAGVAALAAIVLGLLTGGPAAALGIGMGVVLLAMAAFLFFSGNASLATFAGANRGGLQRRLEEATEREARARETLEGAASMLVDGVPDSDRLDAVEAQLNRILALLVAWGAAQERLATARKEEEQRERRASEARATLEGAQQKLEAARSGWRTWLMGRALPETLTPNTVRDLFAKVETLSLQAGEVARLRGRVTTIDEGITNYRSRVQPLAKKHSVSLASDQLGAVASAADKLIERFDAAGKAADRREQAKQSVDEARQRLELQEGRVDEAQGRLGELLQKGGTDDPEAFRVASAEQVQRREFERELRECETRLKQLSGPGDKYGVLLKALTASSPDSIQVELDQIKPEREEAQTQQAKLLEERGSVDTELKRLTSEKITSELRAKRAVLVEELRSHAREWSTLTLARMLLERARAKYEQEHQPEVIKNAQAFFRMVTGGRYQGLTAPLGTQTVSVIKRDGTEKREPLSRGTQEQLYLALRFGLIRQFGEKETCLPVVVDEVLVNFDPARARHAAEAFAQLASTNQVFVFTCHPSTVDLFTSVEPEAQVIDIDALASLGISAS